MTRSLLSARLLRAAARLVASALLAALPARAYVAAGLSWADGSIAMHLQLGAPSAPLIDGATTWGAAAESALAEWNTQLVRSQFGVVRDSTAAKDGSNRINNVFFDTTVYGQPFGENVLAITSILSTPSNGRYIESDVIFNTAIAWNSYRGTRRGNTIDFRRVALHEFGHVLGLDHPDLAQPPQNVVAIMNSLVSDLDALAADDIAGVKLLYDPAAADTPTIVAQPQSRDLLTGDSFTLSVGVAGAGPFTYAWSFQATGQSAPEPFPLAKGASYTIGSVQPADAGRYTVTVRKGSASALSQTATLAVRAVSASTDTALANISTRGVVGRGDDVLIAGLAVGGSTRKTVFVRAAGPALAAFGVGGALANPTLTIRDSQNRIVAENDNWGTGNTAAISAAAQRLGAFQFQAGSLDAALLVELEPGTYSAVVSGVNNTTGIALVEAYDADPDAATARTRRLVNIATRGFVGSGENALIAGLVVTGPGPRTYLIRAVGRTLAGFGVSGALADPLLQIFRGETLLRENDDWDSPSSAKAALREAATKVGAFSLLDRDASGAGIDAAMLITLQPGSYTAKVTGFDSGTGVALVEIYEVP